MRTARSRYALAIASACLRLWRDGGRSMLASVRCVHVSAQMQGFGCIAGMGWPFVCKYFSE
eukprot:1366814-Alexandrium_andersonii.AAC.1